MRSGEWRGVPGTEAPVADNELNVNLSLGPVSL